MFYFLNTMGPNIVTFTNNAHSKIDIWSINRSSLVVAFNIRMDRILLSE